MARGPLPRARRMGARRRRDARRPGARGALAAALLGAFLFGLWHVVVGGFLKGNWNAGGFGIALASVAGVLLWIEAAIARRLLPLPVGALARRPLHVGLERTIHVTPIRGARHRAGRHGEPMERLDEAGRTSRPHRGLRREDAADGSARGRLGPSDGRVRGRGQPGRSRERPGSRAAVRLRRRDRPHGLDPAAPLQVAVARATATTSWPRPAELARRSAGVRCSSSSSFTPGARRCWLVQRRARGRPTSSLAAIQSSISSGIRRVVAHAVATQHACSGDLEVVRRLGDAAAVVPGPSRPPPRRRDRRPTMPGRRPAGPSRKTIPGCSTRRRASSRKRSATVFRFEPTDVGVAVESVDHVLGKTEAANLAGGASRCRSFAHVGAV